jgi:hypothetical protein
VTPSPKSTISQHGGPKRDISVSFKKVSICENIVANGAEDRKPRTPTHKSSLTTNGHLNGSNPSIVTTTTTTTTTTGGQRPSLIYASTEKKAKKVRFFINSDKFFKGATIAVNSEKFRTFDKLLEHLTRIMCNQVTLPQGVRHIFAVDGKVIEGVSELLHGSNYICSSVAIFKKIDYLKIAQDQDTNSNSNQWNRMKRDTCYLGKSSSFSCSGCPLTYGTPI